jgi:hypothetical protein
MDDLDEFDLVELVHADDAAVVASGAACFTTEAGRVGAELDRKIRFSEQGVARTRQPGSRR